MRYLLMLLAGLTGLISAFMLLVVFYTIGTKQFMALPVELVVFVFFAAITIALIVIAKRRHPQGARKISIKEIGITAAASALIAAGGLGLAGNQETSSEPESIPDSSFAVTETTATGTSESETTTTTESTTASTTTTETTTTTTTTETTTTTTTATATTETTTATTTTTTTTVKAELSITYICNTNSMKFHYPSCSSVPKISSQNRADSWQTREELIAMGYDPCGNCHP